MDKWLINQEKKAIRWTLRRFWNEQEANDLLTLIYEGKTSVLLALWAQYGKK